MKILRIISGDEITPRQVAFSVYMNLAHYYQSVWRGRIIQSFVLLQDGLDVEIARSSRVKLVPITRLIDAQDAAANCDHYNYPVEIRPKDKPDIELLSKLSVAGLDAIMDAESDPDIIAGVESWFPNANDLREEYKHDSLTDREIAALHHKPIRYYWLKAIARTKTLFMRMVTIEPRLIRLLEPKEVDAEILERAMSRYPLAYKFVDKSVFTLDMWNVAIRYLPASIKQCPPEIKQVLTIPVEKLDNRTYISNLPVGVRTPEMIEAAITHSWKTLKYTTPDERTEAINIIAAKQNGNVMRHLTNVEKTPAVIATALASNPESIIYLPAKLRPKKGML
jgi:hypothetical protein